MVEIAITAVNLGRKDKGIIYKFTYEAIPGSKRSPAVSPAILPSIRSRQMPVQNFQNQINDQGQQINNKQQQQQQTQSPQGAQYPTIGVDYNEDFSFSPPLIRPAGSSKKPRPQNNYKLTTKVVQCSIGIAMTATVGLDLDS